MEGYTCGVRCWNSSLIGRWSENTKKDPRSEGSRIRMRYRSGDRVADLKDRAGDFVVIVVAKNGKEHYSSDRAADDYQRN